MEHEVEWAGTPMVREEASGVLLRGILAGLLAATVGGVVWGWTVAATDYEIGFVAWGIGLLTGFAVVAASGGERGLPLQVVAVVCSALGVLVGKYLTFVAVLEDMVRTEFGDAAAATVGIFSADTFRFFQEELSVVFGGYDLLWVGFAVWAAWRIPRARRAEAEPV